MEEKEENCKTGLKSDLISEKVFERELRMCKKLNKENGGKCCWGECEKCGVIPLLHKLHKGELLEKEEEIKNEKKRIFKI